MHGRIGRTVVCLAAISFSWALMGAGCIPVIPDLGGGTGGGGVGGGTVTNLPPVAVITSSVSGGIAPLSVDFSSDRSSDDGVIISREWDFGDGGTSLEISPTHVFGSTGTFTVTLSLTDNAGAISTTTTEIAVTEAPVAIIVVDRTEADSAPATINFSAAASFDPDGEIAEYRWDFGDNSTEVLEEVAHTFATSGIFRVRLTVIDDIGISSMDEVLINVGIEDPQVEIRVPPQSVGAVVAPQDGTLFVQGVFSAEAGVPRTIRAGVDPDQDPSNGNDVQLDTDGPNGNDLNLESIAGLKLDNVKSLGGEPVPAGEYFLWAEIDTDRSEASRTYAGATIHIVEPMTDTVQPNNTPRVPFVDGFAAVTTNSNEDRQIFDLGAFAPGDQLFLGLLAAPDFSQLFDGGPENPFSVQVLDENSNIISWFQRGEEETFVLFNEQSNSIVFNEATSRLYVVSDGGFGVQAMVKRGTSLSDATPNRVLIDFDGTDGRDLSVAGSDPRPVLPFDASVLNPAFGVVQTEQAKQAAVDRIQAIYDGFDIEFITTDDLANDPNLAVTPPFSTVHIGSSSDPVLFGLADYVDPRNDTQTGDALVFTQTIGREIPAASAEDMGTAIGNVAAHQIGHLLGLRNTDSTTGIMGFETGWLSLFDDTLVLEAAMPAESEQFGGLPVIGTQDAPALLEATVGTN